MVLCWRRYGRAGGCRIHGGIAQLGEHLPCKQGVKGSNPFISTVVIIRAVTPDEQTRQTESLLAGWNGWEDRGGYSKNTRDEVCEAYESVTDECCHSIVP